MKKICFFVLLSGALSVAAAQWHTPEQRRGPSNDSNRIKVRLAVGRVLLLQGKGQLVFASAADGRGIGVKATNRAMVLGGARVLINGKQVATPFLVLPAGGAVVYRQKRYRGSFLVSRNPDGRLNLINLVGVDSYLRGVVPREMDHRWPAEALKAQAIAARSYVLNRRELNRRQRRAWDVDNSAMSQVYGGMDAEQPSTDRAVAATSGLVVIHRGKLLPCFFHSCCGGHTADIAAVWGRAHPAFRGRRSTFCTNAKYYRWGAVLKADAAARLFGLPGVVTAVEEVNYYRSGRVKQLTLRAGSNRRRISAKKFRRTVGYNRIRSTKFKVRIRGPYLQVLGNGWGHGVGLCQWCAAGMAGHGWDAPRILRFFYRESSVSRLRVQLQWTARPQTNSAVLKTQNKTNSRSKGQ